MFTYQIPNLVNGVGQQALDYRLPNQAEVCDNFWPSVVDGLTKRPGSRLIKKLDDEYWPPETFTHVIDRDELEKYMLVIRPDSVPEAYNLITGEPVFVAIDPDSEDATFWADYVKTPDPARSLRAITIADSTFILNTSVEAQSSGLTTPTMGDRVNEYALFWVKQSAPEGVYSVTVRAGGQTKTASVDVNNLSKITVASIAAELRTKLITELGSLLEASTISSSSVLLRFAPGTLESITVQDPIANTGIEAVFNEVDSIQKLPAIAPQGFLIKVRGDSQRNQDDYWVKFRRQSGNAPENSAMPEFGPGSWIEAVAPNIETGVSARTMPVQFKITGLNSATLELTQWKNREVGDDESAPMPSFVGRKIRSISFFQNRLCLTSEDSVSLSESGDYFNFFPTTVLLLPASDRIDVDLSADKSSDIIAAVPYLQRLILFTRETQFALYGDPVLTPSSISAFPITRLPYDGQYVPQMIGKFIYFAYNQGEYSRVLEYFLERDGETYDSTDTTAHIPRYVPADLHDFSASSDLETLLALPKNNTGEVYIYKFFWQDDSKVQNAWCKFNFPGVSRLMAAAFVRNVMYVINQREAGMYLESLDLSERPEVPGFPFVPFLDLRINNEELEFEYDETRDVTTLTFSNGWINRKLALVAADKRYIELDVPSSGMVEVSGDFRDTDFWCGIPFLAEYVLPPLVLKEADSQSGRVLDYVKAQVTGVEVRANDSGDFTATLERKGWGAHTTSGNVPLIGTPHDKDRWELRTSQSRFFCGGKPLETRVILQSDGPLPLSLTSASYTLRLSSFKQPLR